MSKHAGLMYAYFNDKLTLYVRTWDDSLYEFAIMKHEKD